MTEDRRSPPEHEDWTAVGWFVVGAFIGAACGLLAAPARGRDTRRRLEQRFRDRYEHAARLVEHSKAAVDRARSQLQEHADQASRAITEGQSALTGARQAFEDLRREISRIRKGDRDAR